MIKTKDLFCSYIEQDTDKKTLVLKNVSLEIPKGQFVALLGHNGSGKSTLARTFNAIMLPEGGKVYVDGMDTTDESLLYEIRKKAGMVFQNPDNQLVATIVEEDIAFGPENLGLASEEIRKRVDDALKTVGMYAYIHHAPHMLSGGQKQRIAIAGVLAMRPDCIMLDESTAMLDPTGRKEVMDTIKKLNKEMGITVILITHYMEEAAQADRVVVLENGKLVMDGTPKEVFDKEDELKSLKLGVPEITELAHALRKRGVDLGSGVLTQSEFMEKFKAVIEK
jgi:energy-coupling factor transport system ATP-binding protein